jgi:hypothetical protein
MSSYQANMAVVAAQPEILKQAPAELRQKLKQAGQKLAEIADKNAAALSGGVQASKRILQIVMEALREETMPKNRGYSHLKNAGGRMGISGNAYSPLCPSVAVSRTV